jgi:hypothetical protein
MQEFAFNDKETLHINSYVPSVVDQAGFQLKNADGSDVTADQVSVGWGTDNPGVADISGLAADGKSGDIGSTAPGRAILTATMTYPDGSTKTVNYGLTVGFSAPGEPTVDAAVVPEP